MMNLKQITVLFDRNIEKLNWFAPLLARIVTGVVFIQAGWGKLHHLEQVTQYFQSLHIPAAAVQAPFVAGTELIFGTLVLLGVFTRLSVIPLIGTMIVAILTAKLPELVRFADLFSYSEFLYICLFVWLTIYGAGAVSVDRLLLKYSNQRWFEVRNSRQIVNSF